MLLQWDKSRKFYEGLPAPCSHPSEYYKRHIAIGVDNPNILHLQFMEEMTKKESIKFAGFSWWGGNENLIFSIIIADLNDDCGNEREYWI